MSPGLRDFAINIYFYFIQIFVPERREALSVQATFGERNLITQVSTQPQSPNCISDNVALVVALYSVVKRF